MKKGKGGGVCNTCKAKAPAAAAVSAPPGKKQHKVESDGAPSPRNKESNKPAISETAQIAKTQPYIFQPRSSMDLSVLLDVHVCGSSSSTDLPIRVDVAAKQATSTLAIAEAARLRCVRAFGETFRTVCASLGTKYHPFFENFLWAARAEGSNASERIVPCIPRLDCAPGAQAELARRLLHSGLPEASATAACEALHAHAAQLIEEVEAVEDQASGKTSARKRARTEEPCPVVTASCDAIAAPTSPRMVRLAVGETSVLVSEVHLQKLWFLRCAALGRPPSTTSFLEAAYAVLARLLALQGGHEVAGGMQAACPPKFFDVIRARLGVTQEAFASPLNARFSTFCSAAGDVDAAFGSFGSFFNCTPRKGSFLANPPFEPAVVARMARRMESLLCQADTEDEPLVFVVVVPRWTMPRGPHLPAWQALRDATHTTCVLDLLKSKHSYVNGGQQYERRAENGAPIGLSPSKHDSSVFFLQSRPAAKLMPVTVAMQEEIREAFR